MTPQEKIIQDKASKLHDYYEIYSQEEKWKSQDLCKGRPFRYLPLAKQKVMLRMAELWINEIESVKKEEEENLRKVINNFIGELEKNITHESQDSPDMFYACDVRSLLIRFFGDRILEDKK